MAAAVLNFTIRQGTTKRVELFTRNSAQVPLDFTGSTVRCIIKTPTPAHKTMVVDGSGIGTSTTGVALGRTNPNDETGPLIDTEANKGLVTIQFEPSESGPDLVYPGVYPWECRVEIGNDRHTLAEGMITVEASLFSS